jgi:hypothetical protein
VFHRTRAPLLTWFWAIFFVARHKKGISALQLQRDTGLGSYKTAWTMLHRLRSALRYRPESRLAGRSRGVAQEHRGRGRGATAAQRAALVLPPTGG